MGILSFVIDPDAAIPLTGDEIVNRINTDTTDPITRASSVSVAARPLETDEVTASEIAAGAVDTDELAAGAVTTAKLAAAAVDTTELADGAITTQKLDDDSVTGARTRAAGVLTLTGQPLNNETVVIGAKTYTFQTALTDVDGNVFIGATASDSLDNLIAAINLDAGAGTLYATSMTINTDVTAAAGVGDTMDCLAKNGGTPSNSTTTTETLTDGSWGGATLNGGINAKMVLGASRDDLKAVSNEDREFVKTNPQTGEFRVVGVQRDAAGDLDIEYDSVVVV